VKRLLVGFSHLYKSRGPPPCLLLQQKLKTLGSVMLGFIGRVSLAVVVALAFVVFASAPSRAAILVEIEKSTQTMYVSVNGVTRHQWPVSTGRGRFGTPSGVFRPLRLERRRFSRRYYDSPMPYSVFFHKGYAIHGTTELHRLGGPASHGCVRLHPRNAATLFALVQGFDTGQTRISIYR
jgi:lipoprotein-anchoring transpeptidase ErfK/SrfK